MTAPFSTGEVHERPGKRPRRSVRRVVASANGGAIVVEESGRSGTTFTIRVPAA